MYAGSVARHVGLGLLLATLACGPSSTADSSEGTAETGSSGVNNSSGDASAGTDATPPPPTPMTADTSTTSDATGTTDGPSTTGDASSDTGEPGGCADVPQGCSTPVDCQRQACGALGSWFDASGCLRAPCSLKGTCAAPDEVCFQPAEWGLCASSGVSCEDVGGQCECSSDDDCGGEFCVPDDQAPPALCNALEGGPECSDAGCASAANVRPIVAAGESCLCDLGETRCLWVPPSASVTGGQATAYMHLETLAVEVFEDAYDPAPLGYIACADLDAPPPACECAAVLPCAM